MSIWPPGCVTISSHCISGQTHGPRQSALKSTAVAQVRRETGTCWRRVPYYLLDGLHQSPARTLSFITINQSWTGIHLNIWTANHCPKIALIVRHTAAANSTICCCCCCCYCNWSYGTREEVQSRVCTANIPYINSSL